jgi:hypothetical protein
VIDQKRESLAAGAKTMPRDVVTMPVVVHENHAMIEQPPTLNPQSGMVQSDNMAVHGMSPEGVLPDPTTLFIQTGNEYQ